MFLLSYIFYFEKKKSEINISTVVQLFAENIFCIDEKYRIYENNASIKTHKFLQTRLCQRTGEIIKTNSLTWKHFTTVRRLITMMIVRYNLISGLAKCQIF